MIILLLFGAVSAEHSGLLRSAPAWANVPRFVHCFNRTGPINSDALALWTRPSVRIVTFGCCQAQLATPVNQSEELKIVAAGHQVLEAGSSAQTVLYFPVSARPYCEHSVFLSLLFRCLCVHMTPAPGGQTPNLRRMVLRI